MRYDWVRLLKKRCLGAKYYCHFNIIDDDLPPCMTQIFSGVSKSFIKKIKFLPIDRKSSREIVPNSPCMNLIQRTI